MPNLPYKLRCSLTLQSIPRQFNLIKLFRHRIPCISCFQSLLDSFPCPRSAWEWQFVKRRGRNWRLNINHRVFQILMNSLYPTTKLEQFKLNLGLRIVFQPNVSSYSFIFYFWIIIWVNFNFNFCFSWILISEISPLFIQWFLRENRSKFSDFWFHGFVFEFSFQKYQIA